MLLNKDIFVKDTKIELFVSRETIIDLLHMKLLIKFQKSIICN
jgi:hypothetical protein